jgi:hypothetical protein
MRYLGQTLIFAVAQRAFEINDNWFATLLPLATIDGEVVDPRDFPNRGLAWWMVRGVPEVIKSRPGRLLTATVENSYAAQNSSDPEKDLFQVNYDSVQVAGPKRLLEIVTPEGHTSMDPQDILNGATTASLDHEPTTLVLVRVGTKLYGPLKAEAEEDAKQRGRYAIRFAKTSADRPIYEIDQKALNVSRLSAEVSLDAQSPPRSPVVRPCGYQIALWSAFETASATAATIRLSSDEEIVSRVAKVVMSRSKRQELVRLFKELTSGGVSAEVDSEDLARVEEIALGAHQSVEGVESLVTGILEGGFLAEEVAKAVEAAAMKAVSERASSIRSSTH